MHVVIVYANKEDKIELTKKELEKMLDDAYKAGKDDAQTYYPHPWTITTPSYPPNSVHYSTGDKPFDQYEFTCSITGGSEVQQ